MRYPGYILFLLLILSTCKRNDEECPLTIEDDYVESVNDSIIRQHPGDTINFKVYRVRKDSSGRKYVYTNDEKYIAIDSTTSIQWNPDRYKSGPCGSTMEHVYTKYRLHCKDLTFKGSGNLKFRLYPDDTEDYLQIFFGGKIFQIQCYALGKPIGDNQESYVMEGRKFSFVNYFRGFRETPGLNHYEGYIDSTYGYYNRDYGLLRIILNDTLVLQRKL